MSRSVRDLRELICLSRFGFRTDESPSDATLDNPQNTILFYFDPSLLNNWLEITSSRLEKLRSLSTNAMIDFVFFWLRQFEQAHKKSLFEMELEMFIEHLLLAFTPNDVNSIQVSQFARQVLHDIDKQIEQPSMESDYRFIQLIDVFSRCKRGEEYRSLLASLPTELTASVENRMHLQWMLAIRAFGLVAMCTAAVEFFEKVQETLVASRPAGERSAAAADAPTVFNDPNEQLKARILAALRKGHVEVIEYFIKTNQLTGDPLDNQNRNILFHSLTIGNVPMIEHLLKSKLHNLDINTLAQTGNSLVHLAVSLQSLEQLELLLKYYPEINLNQRNHQDATPLHLAVVYDNLELTRFLVRSGADATLTMKGKTCLQMSTEFQCASLIEFFTELART